MSNDSLEMVQKLNALILEMSPGLSENTYYHSVSDALSISSHNASTNQNQNNMLMHTATNISIQLISSVAGASMAP